MVVAAAPFAQDDVTDLDAVLSPNEFFRVWSPEDVAAAQAGDRAAFTRLYRSHFVAIKKRAYYLLRDSRLAEEVAQDVFESALVAIRKTKPGLHLTAWLYRLTYNRAVTIIRHEAIRPTIGLLDGWDDAPIPCTTEEVVEAREASEFLKEAMIRLMAENHDQATALLWHYRLGIDYEGIEKILGKPKTAVRSLLWRARNSFLRHYNAIRHEDGEAANLDLSALSYMR